jgi:hypothetical protein
VSLYSEKIFHLALSMVHNESQAEDPTQDIANKDRLARWLAEL